MADMKKKPSEVQGEKSSQQFSDKTGELREGKAKGQPSYASEDNNRKNKEGNPDESRITGGSPDERNASKEHRNSDQPGKRDRNNSI